MAQAEWETGIRKRIMERNRLNGRRSDESVATFSNRLDSQTPYCAGNSQMECLDTGRDGVVRLTNDPLIHGGVRTIWSAAIVLACILLAGLAIITMPSFPSGEHGLLGRAPVLSFISLKG